MVILYIKLIFYSFSFSETKEGKDLKIRYRHNSTSIESPSICFTIANHNFMWWAWAAKFIIF